MKKKYSIKFNVNKLQFYQNIVNYYTILANVV